jgi:hypothetical protein
METHTLILLLSLFFCHWLGDYTHLSTNWMLTAKRFGSPLLPIFCHALVHACLMGIVLEIYCHLTIANYETVIFSFTHVDKLFFLQLITHFLIDVWKGKMNFWFPNLSVPSNKGHWYIFGFDQLLHSVVILIMVYLL